MSNVFSTGGVIGLGGIGGGVAKCLQRSGQLSAIYDVRAESAANVPGAPAMSASMAPAKANTAAMGKRETKVYEDLINGPRVAFLSAPNLQGMLEGGVPIMKDGQCLGAVGVSGVKSTEDAQIAKAGIAAIGL